MRKARLPYFFLTIAVLLVAVMGGTNPVQAQNGTDGRLMGTVTSTKGKTIYLFEHLDNGVYSVAAVTLHHGKYVEEKSFKVRGDYQSVIHSVKYDNWISSNPEGGFFAYNKEDNTLYVPLIEEDLTGADRYIVYQFDGQYFVYRGKEAGYWLHPSLSDFDRFYAMGKTKKHRVRIDRMANGSLRYAAWSIDKTTKDEPDITIFNNGHDYDNGLAFYVDNYEYVFDYERRELRVYHDRKLLKKWDMEILYW